MESLWAIVQMEGESLRNYIKRFTSTCTNVKDLSDNYVVQIFIDGLTNEHVRHSLIHENVPTMHKLVTCAYKFVDTDKMREHHSHKACQAES